MLLKKTKKQLFFSHPFIYVKRFLKLPSVKVKNRDEINAEPYLILVTSHIYQQMTTYYIRGAGHRNIYLWSHKLRDAFLSYSVQAAITKYHRLGVLLITTLFFTVLEYGKSKIEVSADSGLLRVSFLVHKWYLLCLYRVEGSRELSWIYFIRALSPSLGFHPHDIITSQRPHFFFFF